MRPIEPVDYLTWEYFNVFYRPGATERLIDLLQDAGRQGWEAYAVEALPGGQVVYMKRPSGIVTVDGEQVP